MDKLKQAFSYTKASQQKEKSKEKQRKAKRSKEENRGQQLQSSLALLEHFPKSIFYMLYTISKLKKSRIQRSNRVRFGAEIGRYGLRKTTAPGVCEIFAQHLPNSHTPFAWCEFSPVSADSTRDLFFWIFLYKFPFFSL